MVETVMVNLIAAMVIKAVAVMTTATHSVAINVWVALTVRTVSAVLRRRILDQYIIELLLLILVVTPIIKAKTIFVDIL